MNILPESPYLYFNREQWASLRDSEPMTLTQSEVDKLRGINDDLSINEVRDIYLPLSRLLNYYLNARHNRQSALMKFLKQKEQHVPFIISVAGSVSAGKSTTSRVLQALLSHWKESLTVALVTTDGFLYPNSVLEAKGLMLKKGFPQSYDTCKLLQFVIDLKSGKQHLKVPKYSHELYDIVPNSYCDVNQPDILILEGLNVLQSSSDYPYSEKSHAFVSDFVDFSIYVDAEEELLEEWFISRFLKLREKALSGNNSHFLHYTKFTSQEAIQSARTIWREINLVNLQQNILPTRDRASLILRKGAGHMVDLVELRK